MTFHGVSDKMSNFLTQSRKIKIGNSYKLLDIDFKIVASQNLLELEFAMSVLLKDPG